MKQWIVFRPYLKVIGSEVEPNMTLYSPVLDNEVRSSTVEFPKYSKNINENVIKNQN